MTWFVFLAVLMAAALHALWNALVKGGAEKHLAMAAVVLGHVPFAVAALLLVPAPAPASWGWLVASIVVHAFYQFFLLFAYRAGDFSQVYPLARGSAPLMVTAFSVTFLGLALSGLQVVAVCLIAGGILSLTLVRRTDGQRAPRAAVFALATGVMIAGYTLVDGIGARQSGSPFGFFAWIAIGNGLTFGAFMLAVHRADLPRLPLQFRRTGLIGGGASFLAYGTVTWAFTQAPIPLVAALRETSIVFALLIGTVAFRERLDAVKLTAMTLTLGGAALLRLATV